jgi:putative sigma-54 modulation protein
MQIDYVGRNYHPDEALRRYTADKLQKASKFLEEPVEVRVTLELEKHRHIADLHVAHRFGVLQATEETGDMQDAINLAVDKIEKQARRSRKRFVNRRRRADRSQNGQQWPVEVVDRASVGGGAAPRVIESTVLAIKPMTIEEAALQLEDSEAGFVVFRDATSDRLSVLYKRRDDNYGLVSPEL